MKKISILIIMLFAGYAATYAQDTTKVSKFVEGYTLSKADVAFINVLVNGPEKSRGSAATEATVDKSKFAAGQKITKEQADLLNTKATAYGKTQKKASGKSRGAVCYYLYCDGYGNCYYIYYYC